MQASAVLGDSNMYNTNTITIIVTIIIVINMCVYIYIQWTMLTICLAALQFEGEKHLQEAWRLDHGDGRALCHEGGSA